MSTGAGSSRTSCRTETSFRWASTSSPSSAEEREGNAVMESGIDVGTPAAPPRGNGMPTAAEAQERMRAAAPAQKPLTIGAVVKQLEREFPDISISKVRYLEDQKLLSPRRTQGGYRLYTPADVERLRTILRLQRDEFLPLRVIRQELASGRADRDSVPGAGHAPDPRALRRASVAVSGGEGALYRLSDVLEETGAESALVRELEDFGVIKGRRRDGELYYD